MENTGSKYPVQKNQIIELSISGMNHEGEGVGKYHGLAVFVPFSLPEEQVIVQIEEAKSSYARGKVLEYLSVSPYRLEEKCSYFKECGGCYLQHYDYSRQLLFKQQIVENALQRIGKFSGLKVLPTIGMDHPFAYRNKAEYPVKFIEGSFKAGFFAPQSTRLVAFDEPCWIQHPLLERVRKEFLKICNQSDLKKVFIEASFHHLIVRAGIFSGEVMVIILSQKPVKDIEIAAGRLVSQMPQVKSIYQSIGQSSGSSIGTEFDLVMGKPFIRERIGGLEFDISPGSFFQVNSLQGEVLFSKAIEYANCKGVAVDAYCGTGSISLFLSREAEKVYGFEIYLQAVKDARHNAAINEIENVEFIQGDAGDALRKLKGISPETVVVDPPRKGCDQKVLNEIINLQPQKIVYVSCNPATLARDLKILAANGYAIKEVQPIDMFPQTYHVECVVLLKSMKC